MSDVDSLLDVFVNVAPRGIDETQAQLTEFVNRVRGVLGPLGDTTINVRAQADENAAAESARRAIGNMRRAVLQFEQEKFELDFSVRLLGRQDVNRRLSDIQSEVRAAQRAFSLAAPGGEGDLDREQAIARVVAARQQELAALRDLTQAELAQSGLDTIYEDRKRQFDAVRSSVREVNTQLSETTRLISLAGGDLALKQQFEDVRSSIKRTIDDITRFSAQGDFLNVSDAVDQLRTLQTSLLRIQSQANVGIAGRLDTEAARSSLQDALSQFSITKGELSIKLRLLGSDIAKGELQEITTRIQNQTAAFEAADKAGNLPARAAALQRINDLLANGTRLLEQDIDAQIAAKGLSQDVRANVKAIDDARDAAQRLKDELQGASKAVKGLGDPRLTAFLEGYQREQQQLQRTLSKQIGANDLIGAAQTVKQIEQLEERVKRLQTLASKRVNINIQAREIANDAVDIWRRRLLDLVEVQAGSVGKLTGEQKKDLISLQAEAQRLLYSMQQVSKQPIISTKQSQQLLNDRTRLIEISAEMEQIYNNATKSSQSFNTLNNNAYQMGQAIEDAAVGFELNGIAGAVRGASNNIAFLINNFAQSEAAVQRFGKAAASQFALFAGIGSAIAVLVLPRLAEWIVSLDDIESSAKDISDRLSESFDDISARVQFALDERNVAQVISEAKGVTDVISEIVRLTEEQRDLRFTITAQLDQQGIDKVQQSLNTTLTDLAEIASAQLLDIETEGVFLKNFREERKAIIDYTKDWFLLGTAIRTALDSPLAVPGLLNFVFPEVDPETVQSLESIVANVERFSTAQTQAIADAREGLVNTAALQDAESALTAIIDEYQQIIDSGNVSAETADMLKKNVEAAKESMRTLRQEAERLESVQRAQVEAAKALIAEVSGATGPQDLNLNRDLEFEAQVQLGNYEDTPVGRFLFNTRKDIQDAIKEAEKLRDALLASGQSEDLAEGAKAAVEIKAAEEERLEIAKELRNLQKELADAEADAAEKAAENAERVAEIQQQAFQAAIDAQQELVDLAAKQQKAIERAQERRANAVKKLADAEADLEEKKKNDQLDAIEEALEARIAALKKVRSEDLRSTTMAIGTVQGAAGMAQVEGGKDPLIADLEKRLADLRAQRALDADQKRLKDLEERIIEARQAIVDADRELLDLQKEQAAEIAKITEKHKAELDKLQKQLEAAEAEQQEEVKKNTEAIDELRKSINQLNNQDQALERAIDANSGDVMDAQQQIEQAVQAVPPMQQPQPPVGAQFRPEEPLFAPEDAQLADQMFGFDRNDMISAQARANEAAMQNTDFSSSSMEALLFQSNKLMVGMQDIMRGLDVSARYTA